MKSNTTQQNNASGGPLYCDRCETMGIEDSSKWIFYDTVVFECRNCPDNKGSLPWEEVEMMIGNQIPDSYDLYCERCYINIDLFTDMILDGTGVICSSCHRNMGWTADKTRQWKEWCKLPNVYPGYEPPGSGHGNIFCFEEIIWESWMGSDTFVVMCGNCTDWVPTSREELLANGQNPSGSGFCHNCRTYGISDYSKWFFDHTFMIYCENCPGNHGYVPQEELELELGIPLPSYEDVTCPNCSYHFQLFAPAKFFEVAEYCENCNETILWTHEHILQLKEWCKLPNVYPGNNPPGDGHGNIFCYGEEEWSNWQHTGDAYTVYCRNCKDWVATTREELEANGQNTDQTDCDCNCRPGGFDQWDNWTLDHSGYTVNRSVAYEDINNNATLPVPDLKELECPQCGDHAELFEEACIVDDTVTCRSCLHRWELPHVILQEWKQWCSRSNVFPGNNPPGVHGDIFCHGAMDWNKWVYAVACDTCEELVQVTAQDLRDHGQEIGGDQERPFECGICGSPSDIRWDNHFYYESYKVYCGSCKDFGPVDLEELEQHATVITPSIEIVTCPDCGIMLGMFGSGVISGNETQGYSLKCGSCNKYYRVNNSTLNDWKEYLLAIPYTPAGSGKPGHWRDNIHCLGNLDFENWIYESRSYSAYCSHFKDYVGADETDIFVPGSHTEMSQPSLLERDCIYCGKAINYFEPGILGRIDSGIIRCAACGNNNQLDPYFLDFVKEGFSHAHIEPRQNPPGKGHGNIFCHNELRPNSWMYENFQYFIYCNNCNRDVVIDEDEISYYDLGETLMSEFPLPGELERFCRNCNGHINYFASQVVVDDDDDAIYCRQCNTINTIGAKTLEQAKYRFSQRNVEPANNPPGVGHGCIFCYKELDYGNIIIRDSQYLAYCNNCQNYVPIENSSNLEKLSKFCHSCAKTIIPDWANFLIIDEDSICVICPDCNSQLSSGFDELDQAFGAMNLGSMPKEFSWQNQIGDIGTIKLEKELNSDLMKAYFSTDTSDQNSSDYDSISISLTIPDDPKEKVSIDGTIKVFAAPIFGIQNAFLSYTYSESIEAELRKSNVILNMGYDTAGNSWYGTMSFKSKEFSLSLLKNKKGDNELTYHQKIYSDEIFKLDGVFTSMPDLRKAKVSTNLSCKIAQFMDDRLTLNGTLEISQPLRNLVNGGLPELIGGISLKIEF